MATPPDFFTCNNFMCIKYSKSCTNKCKRKFLDDVKLCNRRKCWNKVPQGTRDALEAVFFPPKKVKEV